LKVLARSALAAVAAAACAWAGASAPPADAAFPGFNGRIAFSSDVDGDREIFTIAPGGGPIQKLTENGVDDDAPVWSADGSRIAFTRKVGGVDEIFTMNADGTNQVNLTNHGARDQAPTWSPNGRRIAFHSDRADGSNFEIWVMDADGSSPVRLTNDPPFQNANPAWSPDGTRIAFQSGRTLNAEIWWMNPDGSDQTQLTSNGADDIEPAWSPDGTRIAFQSRRSGNDDIWVMPAASLAPATQVTFAGGPDSVPAWAPDGSRIAFQANRSGTNDIYFADAGGADLGSIVPSPGQDRSPDWQPLGGLPPLPPEVGVAGAINAVGSTAATVSASVNPNGRATSVRFEYGPSAAYGLQTPDQSIGAGRADVAVTANLTGLAEGTTYHYRVVATNAAGTVRGPDQVFGTALRPLVVTLAPSRVTQTTLNARGRIDAKGASGLSWHFAYGPRGSFARRTPSVPIGGAGPVEVAAPIAGLVPNRHYNYRLVLEGAGAAAAGGDQAVTTAARDAVETSLTWKTVCLGGTCRVQRAVLSVKLRDGRTGTLKGATARRGLTVGVRVTGARSVSFAVARRVRARTVRGGRATLRFAETASLSRANLTPLLAGVRFGPGSRFEIRVTRPGTTGMLQRLAFTTRDTRTRAECVLRAGGQPRCRRIS
jgi:Tol biopolymer transport system component